MRKDSLRAPSPENGRTEKIVTSQGLANLLKHGLVKPVSPARGASKWAAIPCAAGRQLERIDSTTGSVARLQGSEWLWKLLPVGGLKSFAVVTAASNFAKFEAGHWHASFL